MYHFDITKEPLTNLELKAELQQLKDMRKVQIKYSCISDVMHAFVFIILYFNHFLSGYAILAAVGFSTVVALLLATVSRQANQVIIGLLSAVTTVTTIILLNMVMKESLTGSIIAALTTGSIVIIGATLGRKIKKVLSAIEGMKTIVDDEISWQKVMILCREFPELDTYRVSAAQYLRPYLTYGELAAMQEWAENVKTVKQACSL